MRIVQKLSTGVVASVLTTALFGMVITAGFVNIISNPDTVKGALRESGIYKTGVKGILEAQKESEDTNKDSLSLDEPVVVAAAEKAFTPELLQESTEQFIDSLHPWLEGEVAEPDFSISLTKAKSDFIDTVAAQAKTRLNKLPACAPGTAPRDFDPFKATCRPAGHNIDAEVEKFRDGLADGDLFLSDEAVTAQTFKGEGGDGSAFSTNLKELPEAYQRLTSLPFVLGATALIAAIGLILLSTDRRHGVRRVGKTLLIVGGLLLVASIVANFVIDRFGEIAIGQESEGMTEALKASLITFLDKIGDAVRNTYLVYATAFIALGIIALLALRLTASKADTPASPEPSVKAAE